MKLIDLLYWFVGLDQPSGNISSKHKSVQPDVADTVVAINDEAADIAYDDFEKELLDEF